MKCFVRLRLIRLLIDFQLNICWTYILNLLRVLSEKRGLVFLNTRSRKHARIEAPRKHLSSALIITMRLKQPKIRARTFRQIFRRCRSTTFLYDCANLYFQHWRIIFDKIFTCTSSSESLVNSTTFFSYTFVPVFPTKNQHSPWTVNNICTFHFNRSTPRSWQAGSYKIITSRLQRARFCLLFFSRCFEVF